MSYELIELRCEGDFATITMNSPKRRNALSLKHMLELTDAFREVGESKALGVILAANGPAFCAGHDFADMVGQDLVAMRHLLNVCTTLMETIQAIPQPVLARVHAIATAAGCHPNSLWRSPSACSKRRRGAVSSPKVWANRPTTRR